MVFARPLMQMPVKLKEKFGDTANTGFKSIFISQYHLLFECIKYRFGYEPTEGIAIEIPAYESFKASKPNNEIPIWDQLGDRTGKFLIWENDVEWVEWTFDVETPGLYNIEVEYYPLVDSKSPVARDLLVDGVETFTEMKGLEFPRYFKDAGEPRINPLGDEVKPSQVEINGWNAIRVEDVNGTFSDL